MSGFTWSGDAFALRVAVTLLHFVWQGLILAFVVLAAGVLLRRASARVRYSVNVITLLAMVICLPLTFVMLGNSTPESGVFDAWGVAPENGSPVTDGAGRQLPGVGWGNHLGDRIRNLHRGVPVADYENWQPQQESGNADISQELSVSPASSGISESRWASNRGLIGTVRSWAPLLTWSYFLGVLLMTVRLAIGLRGGQSLRRHSMLIEDASLLTMVREQSVKVGLRCAPAIAYCEQISIPIVIGIVRPMILLPATLVSGLSPDQLQALVTHELSHIRRYDLIVNLLQRIIEAFLFFHPAVWFVSRRISMERENVADDAVVAAGWPAVRYADALVRMAEISLTVRRSNVAIQVAALAASGGSSSEFKRRIVRLLSGSSSSQLRLSRSEVLTMAICTALLIVAPVAVQLSAEEVPIETTASEVNVDDSRSEQNSTNTAQTAPANATEGEPPQTRPDDLSPVAAPRVVDGFVTGPSGAISDVRVFNDGERTTLHEEQLTLAPGETRVRKINLVDRTVDAKKAQIEAAQSRAINFLLERQRADGSWTGGTDGPGYAAGTTALVAIALYDAGEKSDQAVQNATQYLLKASPTNTKEIALQTIFFHLPGKPGAALRRRNLKWLVDSQIKTGPDAGGWGYQKNALGSRADGANTAYAIRALTAVASHAENNPDGIPDDVWKWSLTWLLANQRGDGSWGYSGRGAKTTGAMTACGVAGLKALRSRVESTEKLEAAVRKGEAWLANNWSADSNPDSSAWPLFYLEWLCRSLRDTPQLGKRDWYPEVLVTLLKAQQKDGSFTLKTSTAAPAISTAFALEILRSRPVEQLSR